MWLKWLPWQVIVRRFARSHGFLDPVHLLALARRFAQPSEVGEPIELLRAGMVFHARGLLNSRAIQHNLDWVWPFWVQRQFDPHDVAFIPRAFSLTHVNLTHRNWTAVGLPDFDALPIVDPAGLLTPLYDAWSLDCWVLGADGRVLYPAGGRALQWAGAQELQLDPVPLVRTHFSERGMQLEMRADVVPHNGDGAACRLRVRASLARGEGWLALALRPCNPEGVSFIHDIALLEDDRGWLVNGHEHVHVDTRPARWVFSDYPGGDVALHLPVSDVRRAIRCEVGMASAALLYPLQLGKESVLEVCVPLVNEAQASGAAKIAGWLRSAFGTSARKPANPATSVPVAAPRFRTPEASASAERAAAIWATARAQACKLVHPDPRWQFLYDTAVTTLILHTPGDVYPGPYTYKRFWFRDAAFILHALLCINLPQRARRVLDLYPQRQGALGYFHSQEGEWDSNGEALWILERYCALTGGRPPAEWAAMIRSGARWIGRKRLGAAGTPHAGLFPPGFSAEHLGMIDYYFWDDFWGEAGLHAAAALLGRMDGGAEGAAAAREEATSFRRAIDLSLQGCATRLGRQAMPASPYRRLDAGAIGSLAIGYPLQLCAPTDPRLLDTVEFLLEKCFVEDGFFQDMIHSGTNPYLTLHVAQVLLRAGDERWLRLVGRVAELASPTGQWPEAVHPATGGGCMGDGQHTWAAAEWLMLVREVFVHEECEPLAGGAASGMCSRLLLGQGVVEMWLEDGRAISFGPAPTQCGLISLRIERRGETLAVEVEAVWHAAPPAVVLALPDWPRQTLKFDREDARGVARASVEVQRTGALL